MTPADIASGLAGPSDSPCESEYHGASCCKPHEHNAHRSADGLSVWLTSAQTNPKKTDPWTPLFAEVRGEMATLTTRSGNVEECDADDPIFCLRDEAPRVGRAHTRDDAEETRSAVLRVAAWAALIRATCLAPA